MYNEETQSVEIVYKGLDLVVTFELIKEAITSMSINDFDYDIEIRDIYHEDCRATFYFKVDIENIKTFIRIYIIIILLLYIKIVNFDIIKRNKI